MNGVQDLLDDKKLKKCLIASIAVSAIFLSLFVYFFLTDYKDYSLNYGGKTYIAASPFSISSKKARLVADTGEEIFISREGRSDTFSDISVEYSGGQIRFVYNISGPMTFGYIFSDGKKLVHNSPDITSQHRKEIYLYDLSTNYMKELPDMYKSRGWSIITLLLCMRFVVYGVYAVVYPMSMLAKSYPWRRLLLYEEPSEILLFSVRVIGGFVVILVFFISFATIR